MIVLNDSCYYDIGLPWVQIISDGGYTLTCEAKEINGELYFKHKGSWHRVDDYK